MGDGEFRGGKGGGVKWTEHLFLMLCTFKDNTTYLIQFQINYITCTQLIMSLNRFVKDLRKPPLPPLPVHYHMSVTTSPTSLPSLSIHSGTHITHYIYIDIHRYLPLPVLLAHHSVRGHWCWGIPQSWGFPPHTLDLYCLVQSVSLVNTGDYSPCIVNPDGWRNSYLAEILQHARKLIEC